MSRETVLARVENDLVRRDYERAKNRLHALVRDHPTDLDLRERLAAVYRLAGNPVEAGRWSLLGEHVEHEQATFARAFPDPWQRLAALRWNGQPDDVPGVVASRLRSLAAEVAERGVQVHWHEQSAPTDYEPAESGWLDLAVMLVIGLITFTLLGIGLVTVVRWIA
jgi:hypothetical protein